MNIYSNNEQWGAHYDEIENKLSLVNFDHDSVYHVRHCARGQNHVVTYIGKTYALGNGKLTEYAGDIEYNVMSCGASDNSMLYHDPVGISGVVIVVDKGILHYLDFDTRRNSMMNVGYPIRDIAFTATALYMLTDKELLEIKRLRDDQSSLILAIAEPEFLFVSPQLGLIVGNKDYLSFRTKECWHILHRVQ